MFDKLGYPDKHWIGAGLLMLPNTSCTLKNCLNLNLF